MESKKRIALEKLKQRNFNFPFSKKVMTLIEENLERVQFVNDHVGVRDFLFIAEDDTYFTADFFVALNVECEKEYTYKKNLELMLRKYTDHPMEALKKATQFFKETNRTLYVGVGLSEHKDIRFEEYTANIQNGKTEEEILKTIRRFPDWYDAVALDPKDISYLSAKAEKYIKNLKQIEHSRWNEEMNSILMKNELSDSDHQALKNLSFLLKV